MGLTLQFRDSDILLNPDLRRGLIPTLTTQAELREFEFLNIAEAVAWAAGNRAVKKNLLSSRTLRLLHKQMFGNTWRAAGAFRSVPIPNGARPVEIPAAIHFLAQDTKNRLRSKRALFDEAALRFHYRLIRIQPFHTGNGRYARLAADLLCEAHGWPVFTWGYAQLEANTQYQEALKRADVNDFTPLITFARS